MRTFDERSVAYQRQGRIDTYAIYREALLRARAGEGPTFIEAMTNRAAPHAIADDPSAYIDAQRVEEACRDQCLGRFEVYLRRAGILGDRLADQIRADALDRVREGIQVAEREAPADVSEVFAHAYAAPPPFIERDLDDLRAVLASS